LSHPSHPSPSKFRDNLCPPALPRASRFDRSRSPSLVFRPAEATTAPAQSIAAPARLRARLRKAPLRDRVTLREKDSAGLLSKRTEDLRRSDRSLVAHLQVSGFAGSEHDRPS